VSDASLSHCDVCHEPEYACACRDGLCTLCGADLEGLTDLCWDCALEEMD
jgi:hypothetical protein